MTSKAQSQEMVCPFRTVEEANYPSERAKEHLYGFDLLRHEAPVYQLPGTQSFLVSRYEDIVKIMSNRETFSNTRPWSKPTNPEISAILADGVNTTDILISEDAPGHTAHRKLVMPAFSVKRIASLRPRIVALADELIDTFIDRGEVDFITQYAEIYPVMVLGEMMKLPREDGNKFRKWAGDLLAAMAGGLSLERERECAISLVECQHYVADLVRQRRACPDDTVISDLLAARDEDGAALSETDVISIALVLLRAGFETTTQLLGNLMLLLLRHPDQANLLRSDASLIPKFIEETLLNETPGQHIFRSVMKDTEVAGVQIPAGAQIILLLGSGNRDTDVFANPAEFNIKRTKERPHLGFGFGYHFCIGAPVAREEGIITLEKVLARLKNVRLAPRKNDFNYKPNPIFRGLKHLHLEFDR